MHPRPPRRALAPRAQRRVQPWTKKYRTWIWAGLGSLLFHVCVELPGIAHLQDPVERELEITYMAPDEPPLPPEAPQLAEKPPDPEPDQKKPPTPDQKPKKAEKPPELAERLQQPKKPDKPPEKPPEPPPLEVQPMPHLKMVDQEQFPDEQDNDQARFLAQKNHRAAEDTQSNSRNLVQNMTGETVPSAQANAGDKPGEKERKVAELQDRPGDPTHLPLSAPPGLAVPALPSLAMSPLAMRSPHEETPQASSPEKREISPDGIDINHAVVGPDGPRSQGKSDKAAGVPGQPGESPFRLNNHDYDRVIGYDVAEAERRIAARAEQSHAPGRWERIQAKQGMLRSALENFTPNVRVGNQSELGTRAHPFAAYIAQVHRQIHRFWGDGFLAELDRKPGLGPYPLNLVSALEISLKGDGTINQIIISRGSGFLPFDAAAMESVHMAGPFPAPPKAIKSRDGNVYVTWLFHRDDRQCATDFVSAHILTTPGKPTPPPPSTASPPVASSEPGRQSLPVPGKPTLTHFANGLGGSGTRPAASGTAPGSSASVPAPAEPSSPPAASAKTASTSTNGVADDARVAAERWLTGYHKADIRWLTGSSALPFTAGGKTVAEDGPSLHAFYEDMLGEGTPKQDRVRYYTPEQLKKRRGSLPRGGDEDDMAFAWVELGGDDLILILQPATKGWRVVGIDR